ncbi:hypothetical protein ACRALDRAFT_2027276 [Sodiomyces alcalophilus JCM 7366]|uniref:uncharacterized protein n=1 Tax=Sodiomyces alcalophilus JCM 7366 TaxID=591952 RepID=UPI0039B4435C
MEATQGDTKEVKGNEKTNQKRLHDDDTHLHPSPSHQPPVHPVATLLVPSDNITDLSPPVSASRWWFASSAFPMIAGTLGPVASAFSICSLSRPWRQHVSPGGSIADATFIDDPTWLIVINAVQLAVALIANLFLFMNMTRRVRFSVAQPITIVGWYISSILLLSLNATAAGPLTMHPSEHYVLSQAYYYGVFAAVLYFVVASLMVVTIRGALAKHYSSDFQLTPSQRTLMLQTVLYLHYLLLGALVFSKIEGWMYLDAVYWSNTTLFTIGYGDHANVNIAGRALVIPFSLVGIIILGLLIAAIRNLILDRSLRNLDARMMEKHRRRHVRDMIRTGKDAILEPILYRHPSNDPNSTVSLLHRHHRQPSVSPNDGTKDGDTHPKTEYHRREHEFLLMRRIQARASTRRRWLALLLSFTAWLLLWLVGAAIFQETEKRHQGWSYFDGFYFAFITITTLGYGDRTPITPAGKAFCVFWALLALPTTTVMISNAEDTVILAMKTAAMDLGSITILPGEHGIRHEVKRVLSKVSWGALFPQPGEDGEDETSDEDEDDNVQKETDSKTDLESPPRGSPTVVATTQPSSSVSQGKGASAVATGTSFPTGDNRTLPSSPRHDTSPTPDRSPSSSHLSPSAREPQTTRRRPSFTKRDPTAPLPSSPADYHYLLITEIAAVTRDTRRRKHPKRYTFSEWAWYLKLIGEDETQPHTHTKATPHVHDIRHGGSGTSLQLLDWLRPGRGRGSQNQDQGQHGEKTSGRNHVGTSVGEPDKWSWVGHRSPLLSSQEESEWILDKLTEKLRVELDKERRRGADGS